ncbi:MAG: DUF86 domain-containing protein [Dehalococcoidia bacterium]|nr:MAG: DUF86 domain-containing protein [Dehalococcoidia bacterium]
MRPEGGNEAHLWDMRDAAVRLLRIMSGVSHERYATDEVYRLAAERLLQNIGEAARRLPTEFRGEHPKIAWQSIIGQRNILVHEYGEVDAELVWRTLSHDVDDLVRRLDPLISVDPEAK